MITVGLYGIPDTSHGDRPTYTHDHGVALMRGGHVLTTVQLERWTGVKHDNQLPAQIGTVLDALVPPDEPVRFVSVNAFVGSAFCSLDGRLRIEPQRQVGLSPDPVPADVHWFPDGLHRREAQGWVVCHELAHLASLLPFVGHFEDGALAAHVDGGASVSACSFWRIRGGRPEPLAHSWDLLKDVVNNFNVGPVARIALGLEPDDHLAMPGRLMGYAALGSPRSELGAWLRRHRWFLGRQDAEVREMLRAHLGSLDARAPAMQDLCACLQAAFEDDVSAAILEHEPTDTLYLAGGAALNIPTNARLQRQIPTVWAAPGTNDSGLALGAAALVEYLERGELPVHGPFLEQHGCPKGEPPLDQLGDVVEMLLDGAVVGVCNGGGELGPRALGHRSLIARADDVVLRQRVSERIKRRAWYQPVAPILCAEAAKHVLDPVAASSPLSRFMLGAWTVQPEWHPRLAGVLHGDGTVRAQVVRADDPDNAWMHALLHRLWHDHGVAALINTSFNGPSEPILQRHQDAVGCARRLGLDAVVVHGSLHRP